MPWEGGSPVHLQAGPPEPARQQTTKAGGVGRGGTKGNTPRVESYRVPTRLLTPRLPTRHEGGSIVAEKNLVAPRQEPWGHTALGSEPPFTFSVGVTGGEFPKASTPHLPPLPHGFCSSHFVTFWELRKIW